MNIFNANGTVILFFANIISKLFGAFYRLPLSNILGAEGMGLYQMAFPIYSFLLTLITGGISITLTRQIAIYRAKQDRVGIYKTFVLGRNTSLFFGLIFFFTLLLFAYPLSRLQGNVNAFYGYFAISIGFVFACMLGAYRGYYQGFNNMKPTAISQVLEQGVKLVLGLFFAYLFFKHGVIYGVFGALLGISLSEFFSFLFFLTINKKHISKLKIKLTKKDYSNFIRQVTPVSVTYVLLPFSSLLDSFLIVNLLSLSGFITTFATSLYGIETGMILPLINMPNVLISAIALASLPEISFKVSKNIDIKKQVSTMFKLVLLFILPCSVGLFVLSKPILTMIFPTLSAELLVIANNLLHFSVFEMFFLSFVTISNALLQALGKTKLPAISLSVGIVAKLFLTLFLVSNPLINIYGLVLSSIVCYFIASVINVAKIKKITNFRLNFLEIITPLFASIVMTTLILLIDAYFGLSSSILGLFILVIFAIIVYFGCLLAFKQFSFKDLKKALQTRRE